MAEIVNLNKARKQRQHDAKRSRAEQNRRKYGRTKVIREMEQAARERQMREIDGKRMEVSPVRDSFGADVTFYHRDEDERDGDGADSPAIASEDER